MVRSAQEIGNLTRQEPGWADLLARAHGDALPDAADPAALSAFLGRQRAAHPEQYADLSLAVVKLLGPGEYAVEQPGDTTMNHFGLAAQDYTHGTAPNRRYADLVTQRLVDAVRDARGELYVWTVDEQPRIRALEALGVTGIITNDPRLFGAVV